MEREKLRNHILTSDLLLADLDGVLANAITNSLRQITFNSIKQMPTNFKESSHTFTHCTRLLTKKITQRPDAELLDYCLKNILLGKSPDILYVNPKKTIYKKVEDFFQKLEQKNPNMKKALITRNFCNTAYEYGEILNFNKVYCNKLITQNGKITGADLKIIDEHDKYDLAKKFIQEHPGKKATIFLDTKEDIGMVKAAQETLETLVIGIAPKNGITPYCDSRTNSKDWTELYKIIK